MRSLEDAVGILPLFVSLYARVFRASFAFHKVAQDHSELPNRKGIVQDRKAENLLEQRCFEDPS